MKRPHAQETRLTDHIAVATRQQGEDAKNNKALSKAEGYGAGEDFSCGYPK